MNKISGLVLGTILVIAAETSASAAPRQPPKATELHFGGEPWYLALSLGDLKPTEGAESTPDRQIFTYDDDRGTVLSVIVENAHAPATMTSCRGVFAQRKQQGILGMLPVNENQGQRGEAATQEFDVRLDFEGKSTTQHSAYSCRVRGIYYIDVHASKVSYRPADHDALMSLIDAVTIVDSAEAAAPPQGIFTPAEQRAIAAIFKCQKLYFDSIAQDDRRRRGESLIEESYAACANEQAALRNMLSSRFNAQATDHVMQLLRDSSRDDTLRYIKR